MSQLEKHITMVNKAYNTTNKEAMISKKLENYLSRPVNYTLLAELCHLNLIILPDYRLILLNAIKISDEQLKRNKAYYFASKR